MQKGEPHTIILRFLLVAFWVATANAAESKPNWQTEWERTVKAAEEEGQLTIYVSGYGALIDSGIFQKTYPKIKVTSVTGSGTKLAPRVVAERRGEKYLADVYSGGGTSLYQNLYLGKMLDPIKPALILPEVVDPSNGGRASKNTSTARGATFLLSKATWRRVRVRLTTPI